MSRHYAISLLLLVPLPGCTTAWSIEGAFADSQESLTGAATRYMDGGTFEIYGARGTHCTGSFATLSATEGRGRVLCDDRRSGAFMLNTQRKIGHGDLNGRAFTFVLGNPRDKHERKARLAEPAA